jgi:Zn-dependent protease with chaperone function
MSLTIRAILAILLMVGFYVLSFAVVAGLLFIPYAEWTYLHRIDMRVVLGCIVSACLILWSIFPRRDRFAIPGPRIQPDQHPELFAELSAIAKATGQELPQEVYLTPEVNAWVAQRGGTMGFGSRRVMGLGVPLMALLTVSQFRAVLAHEFGHYSGGDTKLGPWIYKTRAAIGRTLFHLEGAESVFLFLFKWYGNLFLRVTLAISRAQEYAADRLGARIGGAKALIDGLKQVHVGALAWGPYAQSEVMPMLSAGYSAPLSMGFRRFLQVPSVQSAVAENLNKELSEGKANSFDSHPALRERIAALETMLGGEAKDDRRATELLENYDLIDARLFLPPPGVSLKSVAWEELLNLLFIPQWRTQVESQQEALQTVTARNLATEILSGDLRSRIKNPAGVWPTTDERGRMARTAAGCALALALIGDNWTVHSEPGEPVYFEKNERRVEPFIVVEKIRRRELTPEQWEQQCVDAGIINLPLGYPSAAGAAESTQ